MMTKQPVPSLIIKLGIPTMISMFVTTIYNMADSYFVGQINTSASGATGVVLGLMAILQAVGFIGLPFCRVGACRIRIGVFLGRSDEALQVEGKDTRSQSEQQEFYNCLFCFRVFLHSYKSKQIFLYLNCRRCMC